MKDFELGHLLLLIFILSSCRMEKASSSSLDIIELTEQNFEEQLRNKSLLVMFYQPGCEESCDDWRKLLGVFGQTMKESEIFDVAIGTAECTPDKGLCEALQTYSMSLENRLCADNERQAIIDADECKSAATEMKREFKDKRSRQNLPKGCYFLVSNNLIYFNTHLSGSKSDSAQQVCKGIGNCKPNPLFEDSAGFSCEDYANNKWCTSTGGYGEGWIRDGSKNDYGTFDSVAKDGETGIVCPECGCKAYRFQMYLEDPKLKFFKSPNSSVDYVGPQTILGLRSFVNEETGRGPTPVKTESDLVLETGCKKKEWAKDGDADDGSSGSYRWVGSGQLLEKGVCIEETYQKFFAPEQGKTMVNCIIEYQKVRKVDAKEQTLSIDLLMNLKWHDPNIQTNFTTEDKKNGGVALRKETTEKIWTPDLYIWNSTTLKSKEEWASLKRSQIFSIKNITEQASAPAKTIVEMIYEIKTTVYCDFQFLQYPMDVQNCSIRIGSGSEGAIFLLKDDVNKNLHLSTSYNAVGLNMTIRFFGKSLENRFGNSTVGFHIEMNRLIYPFLMEYYVPCIAIVFVSELGFVIPLTAIPGRVALLVTQFLTLVNLFIHQMSESPTSSEMTILGTYILVSLAFVAFAMVEFAFIIMLNRKVTTKQNEQKVVELHNNKRKKQLRTSKSKVKVQPSRNEARKDGKSCVRVPPIHIIDLAAFFLHFVAFLIFNICYVNKYGN